MAIRLWTTLLDEAEHTACALVGLPYVGKKICFTANSKPFAWPRQPARRTDPGPAAQEVLAMQFAASFVAMQHKAVADRADVEILPIRLAKVLHKTAPRCELLAVGEDPVCTESLGKWI